MRFLAAFAACSALFLAQIRAEENGKGATPASPAAMAQITQGWLIQESASFRIVCRADLPDAKRLPEACEALRKQLQETWLGGAVEPWSPRCEIVVYPT